MNCPHCQTPLVADARFCPACGQATLATESGTAWLSAGGAPDLVGREIAGRYRILKKLGEGGMGAVYRGEQISLKRAIAVKVLRPEVGKEPAVLRRFNSEAEAIAKLSHPNTVNIYDFGQDADGSLFIAMEFIEGRSLREVLQKEGPLSPQRALGIAMQIAASLSDAHAHSIVHRDLKPDNVMLQERGKQKDVVRVLDFGIAKLRDDSRATQAAMTQAGDMLGTPQYMAPEQIKGEVIDGRTDVYALGCMIYEMVTARLPFEAPTVMAMLSRHLVEDVVPPTQRRPELHLPIVLDQLVLAAMAKEVAQRPPTMEAYAEMIGEVLAMFPQDTHRTGPNPIISGGAVGAAITPATPSSFGPLAGGPVPSGFGAAAPYMPAPMSPQAQYMPPPMPPAPYMPGMQNAPYSPIPPAPISPTMAIHGNRSSSRAPLFAAIAVVVLAGGGIAAWQLTKSDKKSDTKTEAKVETKTDTKPDDKTGSDPSGTSPKVDPWSDQHGSSGSTPTGPSTPNSVGTDLTPIPPGAGIDPPPGFTKTHEDPQLVMYANPKRGLTVGMASLYAGTNDPDELSERYASETGMEFVQKTSGISAGANRTVLIFSGKDNGVDVLQAAVLYISPTYRLAVLYQASLKMWQDEAFQKEVDAFFINNIHLP